MAENPFVYGEVVPKSAFVGRDVELGRLTADLADGQKIFLISPRRYGKSSLVAHALSRLARRRVLTLEITVSSFSSYVAFLEGYTRAIASLDAAPAGRSWLRDLLHRLSAGSPHRQRRRRGHLVSDRPQRRATPPGSAPRSLRFRAASPPG